MPNLPTLFVTDAQATRMIAAFGSAENYKTWLKEQIIRYVTDYEIQQDDTTYLATRETKRAQTIADLEPPA
jgi:uncharacterized NAD(P)/FAD-binding protein YdhS